MFRHRRNGWSDDRASPSTARDRVRFVILSDEETNRPRAFAVAQSRSRARSKTEPETERPADISGKALAEEPAAGAAFHETMTPRDQLPAMIAKISDELSKRPEYFVTHPAEMKVLNKVSDAELDRIAHDHGWRFVRRVGRRQIQFYNDVSVRPIESGRNTRPR